MRMNNTPAREPRPTKFGKSQLRKALDLPLDKKNRPHAHQKTELRDYGCRLSIATLSAVTMKPRHELQAATRSSADVAFARQIAMYLAHTKFGIPYSEVGDYFHRDRTTVAHACQLVEDRRDDKKFDDHLVRMECLMDAALPQTLTIHQFLAQKPVGDAA